MNRLIWGVSVLVAALLAASSPWIALVRAGEPVRDARGIEVIIEDASRIVSIGGSVTEIIYALGEEERLVAVDTTSSYPEAAAELPNVGYMRALSAEGVLSTAPSLVLAIEDAGPPETMDVLAGASVPLVAIPNEFSLAGTIRKVRLIARILDAQERGERLIRDIRESARRLDEIKSRVDARKRVMFVLTTRDGAVMAAGRNTPASKIIELAGADNALQGFEGFKMVDAEGIVQAAPEVILMMKRGNHTPRPDDIFKIAAIKATPAGADRGFIAMDGLYLLGFGPRTPDAARELAEHLYVSPSQSE